METETEYKLKLKITIIFSRWRFSGHYLGF